MENLKQNAKELLAMFLVSGMLIALTYGLNYLVHGH